MGSRAADEVSCSVNRAVGCDLCRHTPHRINTRFACFHRSRSQGNYAILDPDQTRPGLQFRDTSAKKKKKRFILHYSCENPQNNPCNAATEADLKTTTKKAIEQKTVSIISGI